MSNHKAHGSAPGLGGEFTMCGTAFDAYDSGDEEEPIIFAEPGKRITCVECLSVIEYYKAIRYNLEPEP